MPSLAKRQRSLSPPRSRKGEFAIPYHRERTAHQDFQSVALDPPEELPPTARPRIPRPAVSPPPSAEVGQPQAFLQPRYSRLPASTSIPAPAPQLPPPPVLRTQVGLLKTRLPTTPPPLPSTYPAYFLSASYLHEGLPASQDPVPARGPSPELYAPGTEASLGPTLGEADDQAMHLALNVGAIFLSPTSRPSSTSSPLPEDSPRTALARTLSRELSEHWSRLDTSVSEARLHI